MTGLLIKYFVLKPGGNDAYAAASRGAMARYAELIHEENPSLSADLLLWIAKEQAAQREKQDAHRSD